MGHAVKDTLQLSKNVLEAASGYASTLVVAKKSKINKRTGENGPAKENEHSKLFHPVVKHTWKTQLKNF